MHEVRLAPNALPGSSDLAFRHCAKGLPKCGTKRKFNLLAGVQGQDKLTRNTVSESGGNHMLSIELVYAGAALTAIWGAAHLLPAGAVVKGFGAISEDNRRIITMEWIVEGVTLIFIGVLVASAAFIDPAGVLAKAVWVLSAAVLIVLAVVSLFTGFKVHFLPFKLCPFIFIVSAILILAGGLM